MVKLRDIYGNRRVGIQLPLGFASGLPYLLVGETLRTWLATEGIDLKTVGLFALCGLAYNFKIAWAPLVDRYPLPLLGRRRGWIVCFQLALVAALYAMSHAEPKASPERTALLAVIAAFFAASQDIVVDAYKADVLGPDERAAGAGVFSLGYRMGMFASGAIALGLVQWLGWPGVYRLMAKLMLVGVAAAVLAPEPSTKADPPGTIVEAYVRPLADLVSRKGAWLVIAFIVLFRFGYLVALPMNAPFLIKTGFSPADLAFYRKGVGLFATLAGSMLAGPLVARLGTYRSLFYFGIAQALIHLSWIGLVYTGPAKWMLAITIVVENVFIGLAMTAFDAYLMTNTRAAFSATQLAALTSLSSVGGTIFGASSGVLATTLGWTLFFGLTSVAAIPSLVLVAVMARKANTPLLRAAAS